MPPQVRFTTYTLRYPTMKWITLDALEKHWERADIDAELVDEGTFRVKTKNVAAFTIALPVAPAPLDKTHPPRVVIDGQEVVGRGEGLLDGALPQARRQMVSSAESRSRHRTPENSARRLEPGKTPRRQRPDRRRVHGLVPFRPPDRASRSTTRSARGRRARWSARSWNGARVFRGDVRVKDDTALTADDVANANLILWGDPSSNAALAQAPRAPAAEVDEQDLTLGALTVSAADHAPILIYPNPRTPSATSS